MQLGLLVGAGLAGCDRGPAPVVAPPAPRPGTSRGPSRSPLPTVEPIMRVRVLRARGDERTVRVGFDGQPLRFGPPDDPGTLVMRAPLAVRLDDDRWLLEDARGRRGEAVGPEPLEIHVPDEPDPVIRLAGRTYPGSLRLISRTDVEPDAFDVVNLVALEAYLPGVIAAELFSHWKIQTRGAQAIAARSFACSEHDQFAGRRDYDVTATARSQVYLGRVRHEDSIEAVAMTRGIVLGWDSMLVPGYYSSCCGGLAASAVDVINDHPANDVPPLHGRTGEDVCREAKVSRKVANWTVKRELDDLHARVTAWAKRRGRGALGKLQTFASLEVAERNRHGRPTRYTITDTADTEAEIGAESLRRAADYAGGGLARHERGLWSSHFRLSINRKKNRATFEGHGFGHGAGLCQYGAEILAREGTPHHEILSWYYPGVELVQAY